MENKRLIVLFAVCFSCVFSILYYFLFTVTIHTGENGEKRTLYMNQIGLYGKQDSVKNMKDKLKSSGFVGYELKQDKLIAVVCSVSVDEKSTKDEQDKLKEAGYTFIAKSVTVEDPKIVSLINNKEFDKALERIGK